jgi:hypothetical protein
MLKRESGEGQAVDESGPTSPNIALPLRALARPRPPGERAGLTTRAWAGGTCLAALGTSAMLER